jgi:uncharacterized phage protein (TIGR01671 family)
MREIKFRAWVVNGKAMADWETITKECDRLSLLKDDNFIFMQFTGLTDKNGVEIFESDVVKHTYDDGDLFAMVKFEESEAGFITEGVGEIKGYPFCFNEFYSKKCEVIGNIHENPELLCAKK